MDMKSLNVPISSSHGKVGVGKLRKVRKPDGQQCVRVVRTMRSRTRVAIIDRRKLQTISIDESWTMRCD